MRKLLSTLAVVLIVLCGLLIMEYLKTSAYDRARMRVAERTDVPVAMIRSDAYNLFAFNSGQIDSGELLFPTNLEREFKELELDGFYDPVQFYMDYQGHDWDGRADDQHRIVFCDGSSVVADIYCGALRVRYFSGWRKVAKNTLVSDELRELYVLPTGEKVWRTDGRIFFFAFDHGNAWVFNHNSATHIMDDGDAVETVSTPFNYDQVVRWCGLSTEILTFATYDGMGGVVWLFNNGDSMQLYASPITDPDPDWFKASNYESALITGEIIYDLPDGRVTITSNGDIIRE